MLKFEDLKEDETRLQEKKARAPRTKPRTATVLYLYPEADAVMLQVDAAEGYKGSCTRLTWKQVKEKWEMVPETDTTVPPLDAPSNYVDWAALQQQVADFRQRIYDLENCLANTARERNFQQQRADSLEQRLGQTVAKPKRVAELEKACAELRRMNTIQYQRISSLEDTDVRSQLNQQIQQMNDLRKELAAMTRQHNDKEMRVEQLKEDRVRLIGTLGQMTTAASGFAESLRDLHNAARRDLSK
jgi:myosin heavy subunit